MYQRIEPVRSLALSDLRSVKGSDKQFAFDLSAALAAVLDHGHGGTTNDPVPRRSVKDLKAAGPNIGSGRTPAACHRHAVTTSSIRLSAPWALQ